MDPQVDRLREQLRAHPVHALPDREDRLRWAERHLRLERDTEGLRRRIDSRTNSIARQFDRVCEVLDELGYLDGDEVTPDGRRLARLYSELDLVAAECLRHRVWDELEPAELAAVLSSLVFESRNSRAGAGASAAARQGSRRRADHEPHLVRAGRDGARAPRDVLAPARLRLRVGDVPVGTRSIPRHRAGEAVTAGDFVRTMKQLLDVIDQVADAAGDSPVRRTARQASDLLRHGVIAYSSLSQ
jgi:ATP-dependent RNA helicase HelY